VFQLEKSKTGNQKHEINNRKSKKREDKEKKEKKKEYFMLSSFFLFVSLSFLLSSFCFT